MATILVADDNATFAELVRALLEDAGHSVVTAYSGLSAIASVEQQPVDAAVLDVLIPQISGDAVAVRLRQLRPGLPIVLMTGADQAFVAGSGLPVLRKPFTREQLLEQVEKLLPAA
jgi:two-component system, OmpR family, alkaline phosphatase synthesis response regulator PhoP